MKTVSPLLFLLLSSFFCMSQDGLKYNILTNKSLVKWNAKKVTGEHNGVINVKNGYATVVDSNLTGGVVFMDMKSIVNLDIKDEESKQKLLAHLSSADFFNTSHYPECVFKIYNVKPMDLKDSEFTHIVEGELTIKGYTKPLGFPITIELKDNKLLVKGRTDVDRTLYDIKYGSGKFFDNLGDNLIFDMFSIDFSLVATLPEDGKK